MTVVEETVLKLAKALSALGEHSVKLHQRVKNLEDLVLALTALVQSKTPKN